MERLKSLVLDGVFAVWVPPTLQHLKVDSQGCTTPPPPPPPHSLLALGTTLPTRVSRGRTCEGTQGGSLSTFAGDRKFQQSRPAEQAAVMCCIQESTVEAHRGVSMRSACLSLPKTSRCRRYVGPLPPGLQTYSARFTASSCLSHWDLRPLGFLPLKSLAIAIHSSEVRHSREFCFQVLQVRCQTPLPYPRIYQHTQESHLDWADMDSDDSET